MSDHSYSTALSHAVLAGTSIYCLLGHTSDMGVVCYGLIAANSLLGLWRWGNPDAGETAKSLYSTTYLCQEILSLGAFSVEVWGGGPYWPQYGWVELLLPIIPLSMYFLDRRNVELERTMMAVNGISCVVVGAMTSNYWSLAASLSYIFGFFYIKDKGSIGEIPSIDLINYELCFFCYFAMRTLKGA